jgi:AraC-like DNA-binding protein
MYGDTAMLDARWTKALVETARSVLWDEGCEDPTGCADWLLQVGQLRPPRGEAERLILLGVVEDLRQKLMLSRAGHEPRIAEVVAYVRAHGRDCRLTRARVAQALGLSDSWIAHRFKECVGLSFDQFVRNIRIADAAVLLESSDASVKHIALTVGFRDQGSFGRVFKARMGLSPVAWRASRRTSHLAPRTSHLAPRTSHLAPRTKTHDSP